MSELPEQDRNTFDAALVLDFVRTSGNAPQQGWYSLVEEACHRLIWMERRLQAARGVTDEMVAMMQKFRELLL